MSLRAPLHMLESPTLAGLASSALGDSCVPYTFVKRVAALREECRIVDVAGISERTITPYAVGPHLANRNGVCINGHMCEELFKGVQEV